MPPTFGRWGTEVKFTDGGHLLNCCKPWVHVIHPGLSSQDAILFSHPHTSSRLLETPLALILAALKLPSQHSGRAQGSFRGDGQMWTLNSQRT